MGHQDQAIREHDGVVLLEKVERWPAGTSGAVVLDLGKGHFMLEMPAGRGRHPRPSSRSSERIKCN